MDFEGNRNEMSHEYFDDSGTVDLIVFEPLHSLYGVLSVGFHRVLGGSNKAVLDPGARDQLRPNPVLVRISAAAARRQKTRIESSIIKADEPLLCFSSSTFCLASFIASLILDVL
jgi:hypothetical protein